MSQRWIASAFNHPATGLSTILLAYTSNSVPTGLKTAANWTRRAIVLPAGASPDFDCLGVDANGVYLSVWDLAISGSSKHKIYAILKTDLFSGTWTSTTYKPVADVDNGLNSAVIQPAVNFDNPPTGGYVWFLSKGAAATTGSPPVYRGGSLLYRRLKWVNSMPTWADASWVTLADPPSKTYRDYFDFDGTSKSAPQPPGSGLNISVGRPGSRLGQAVIRHGLLWVSHHVGLQGSAGNYGGGASGSTVDRSAVQWFKLNLAGDGSGLSSLASGPIFDPSASNPLWFYFPSQTPNCANDVVFGVSGSSANVPISAYFSWLPGYQATTTTPQIIKAGTGSYLSTDSWGDYFATVVDPVDDLTFWTFQEYLKSSTDFGTWIQKISQATNPAQ